MASPASLLEQAEKLLNGRRESNRDYLLETVSQTVRELVDSAQKFDSEHQRFISQEFPALVLDGFAKVERLRAHSRVCRIGLILRNAAVCPAAQSPDEIEELMRVAVEVSDREAQLLGELLRIQPGELGKQGRTDRYSAWTLWEKGPWGTGVDSEIDSVFSKLEALGLVTRIPPPSNLTILADFQNRYALLLKGARFSQFTRDSARSA